jgi:hypothetical protein
VPFFSSLSLTLMVVLWLDLKPWLTNFSK